VPTSSYTTILLKTLQCAIIPYKESYELSESLKKYGINSELDLAREKQPLKLTQTKMFPYASGIGEQ
jgi:hypothetical protein